MYDNSFHSGDLIELRRQMDEQEEEERINKSNQKKLAPFSEDRIQKVERISKRFKLIVDKYGIKDSLNSMYEADLDAAERLLTKIEDWVLFDSGYPTALMYQGLRYDAWDGNNRLVIIDAPSLGSPKHMHAFDFTGKGLKFSYYRSESADKSMTVFKARTENTNAKAPTLIIPKHSSATPTVVAEKKADKPVVVAQAKPNTAKPKLNSHGRVIYEPDPIDVAKLDLLGIDTSQLQMIYEDQSPKLEGFGGCKYKVMYNGVYMGYFGIQRQDGKMREEGEVEQFRNAYAGKDAIFLNAVNSGKLWKFAIDADQDNFGDPDFLTMLLQGGFPNSKYDGLSGAMLISGAVLDVSGSLPGMSVGMVNLVRMMRAEAKGNVGGKGKVEMNADKVNELEDQKKKGIVEQTKSQTVLPEHAIGVRDFAKNNNGKAQPGYKGNAKFANDGRGEGEILPEYDGAGNEIVYSEYDVYPFNKGVNRGNERVVIGTDGNAYYTYNHYLTFIKMP